MTTRSTTFNLIAEARQRQPIIDSIRRYRHACREMYGVLLTSQAAGAHIVDGEKLSLKPDGNRAAAILACAMDRAEITKVKGARGQGVTYTITGVGANLGYDMRSWFFDELYPEAKSFVWDSARRAVATTWTSGDPEFPKVNQGYLALQGARGTAKFMRRAIAIDHRHGPILDRRTLMLHWDHTIGPVEFALAKTDGGRWQVWDHIRDGVPGWELGTVYLTERYSKKHGSVISADLSHQRPDRQADVDPARVCRLTIDQANPAAFLTLSAPDGDSDVITGHDVEAWLTLQLARKQELELRRASCGNPNAPWGHRKAWLANQDVLSRATHQRERRAAACNHFWSLRLVSRAALWRCGKLEWTQPEPNSLLFGHPWNWTSFAKSLAYKTEDRGIAVTKALAMEI